MLRPAVGLAVLLAGGLPYPLHAEPPRVVTRFSEHLVPTLKVSGSYVVAVMNGPRPTRTDPHRLTVWIPPDAGARLCVSVRSIDGRYEAPAVFDVSATAPGAYALEFGADPGGPFASYAPGELAIAAAVGSVCPPTRKSVHVPMDWGTQPRQDTLTVLVNGDGMDAVALLPLRQEKGRPVAFPCKKVDAQKPGRVFSLACVINNASRYDFAQGWLELYRFGDLVARDPLHTAVPGSP